MVAGLSLVREIAQAAPIHVSTVATGKEARFFESAEAAHSSHSAAGQVRLRLDCQCKYGRIEKRVTGIVTTSGRTGWVVFLVVVPQTNTTENISWARQFANRTFPQAAK